MHNQVRIPVALACLCLACPLAAQTITEFLIPTVAKPLGIAAGPDGNIWFTEAGFGSSQIAQIGRITMAGVVTEFPIPTPGSVPVGITAGPDGNLWFTENSSAANRIGRITTAGVITEFQVPTAYSFPRNIVAGPDGSLWFTEVHQIGRITTTGVITEFSLPHPTAGDVPEGITAGPDGNIWFTEGGGVGRMTTAGVITEFPVPSNLGPANGIAAGPDGNLWFTASNIGRITTAGVITEFDLPVGPFLPGPVGIAAGPDGNLWFTEMNSSKIGRITTAGVVTEFSTPTVGSLPYSIAAGPDGDLWFTENAQIGRITTGSCAADDTTLCLSSGRFMVTANFETRDGTKGAAHARAITANTGYFWFFEPSNVEVVTKILPFCADPFNSIWIFAAGLTNVKVELTYTDTSNGTVVTKKNDLGVPFAPVQDTEAFKTCP